MLPKKEDYCKIYFNPIRIHQKSEKVSKLIKVLTNEKDSFAITEFEKATTLTKYFQKTFSVKEKQIIHYFYKRGPTSLLIVQELDEDENYIQFTPSLNYIKNQREEITIEIEKKIKKFLQPFY
jgi:hypothetical protein